MMALFDTTSRAVGGRLGPRGRASRESHPSEDLSEPVSYTHLDVYKRQVYAGMAHVDLALLNDHELDLDSTMMYRHEDYVDAIRLVSEGKIQLNPLMSRHFAFGDYQKAYEYIDANREATMKVLIDVAPCEE